MCKRMLSLHYLKNYDSMQCMRLYANEYMFPEIDETELWCNPARYTELMDLQSGRLLKTATALVAATLVVLAALG